MSTVAEPGYRRRVGYQAGLLGGITMVAAGFLVAGNIGTGKTSLTERLGEHLDWETAYESVVDNPYLSDLPGHAAMGVSSAGFLSGT